MSNAFCAVPTISVESPAVANSSTRRKTFQPSSGAPNTVSACTLSNLTCHIRIRDKEFLTVQCIAGALFSGLELDTAGVKAASRLGEREGGDKLTLGNFRE